MNTTGLWVYLLAALVVWNQGIGPERSRTGPRDPYQPALMCTPYTAGQRTPITVSTSEELQSALDTAAAGDTILLKPGVTFRPVAPEGSFMLRNRPIPAGQWVTVRSASAAFDV